MDTYTNPALDVPSPIDLRDAQDAQVWAERAEGATPGRLAMRAALIRRLQALAPTSVLELGSGPGFLAADVLLACAELRAYTAFDFSEPMLAMSRARLSAHGEKVTYVLGDFTRPDWSQQLTCGFDAVISVQAVHELRHKRHAAGLYAQVRGLLRPGGALLVSDHTPRDASLRATSLFMTVEEQLEALGTGGFVNVSHLHTAERLVLVGAHAP